jgi:hypothetical protein
MSMALDLGWPPSEIRTLTQRDVAALDAEIKLRNRKAKRKH